MYGPHLSRLSTTQPHAPLAHVYLIHIHWLSKPLPLESGDLRQPRILLTTMGLISHEPKLTSNQYFQMKRTYLDGLTETFKSIEENFQVCL